MVLAIIFEPKVLDHRDKKGRRRWLDLHHCVLTRRPVGLCSEPVRWSTICSPRPSRHCFFACWRCQHSSMQDYLRNQRSKVPRERGPDHMSGCQDRTAWPKQLHKQKKGWSGYTGVVMYGVRQESGQHSQHQREKQQQPGWW